MQQQTVGLLSFKGQPKEIYDAQVTFNMLARYGEEAPQPLEDAELRIERHLATLLSASSHAPMPSLRLIQAPVFHGHSFSLWVEFEENPGVDEIERVLRARRTSMCASSDLEPPNNAGIAGQDGIAVGAIVMDRNHTQACWIWAAADNLRLHGVERGRRRASVTMTRRRVLLTLSGIHSRRFLRLSRGGHAPT